MQSHIKLRTDKIAAKPPKLTPTIVLVLISLGLEFWGESVAGAEVVGIAGFDVGDIVEGEVGDEVGVLSHTKLVTKVISWWQ